MVTAGGGPHAAVRISALVIDTAPRAAVRGAGPGRTVPAPRSWPWWRTSGRAVVSTCGRAASRACRGRGPRRPRTRP